MSASTDRALFCLFHNDHQYACRETDVPVSHIFSAVVQRPGALCEMTIQDYNGTKREIETKPYRTEFNLAAVIPIPNDVAEILKSVVKTLNYMGRQNVWPFYFSRDMAIKPHHEKYSCEAIAPEGHIDPPEQPHIYGYGSEKEEEHNPLQLTRARINCVRMTLLAAQMAGIKVTNIADIAAWSNTGEEVRDSIRTALTRSLTDKNHSHAALPSDHLFETGPGMIYSRVALTKPGLTMLETDGPVQLSELLHVFNDEVQGRSLFEWLTEGQPNHFLDAPTAPPSYLASAIEMLQQIKAGATSWLAPHIEQQMVAAGKPSRQLG